MIDMLENLKFIESPDVPFPLLQSSDRRKLQRPVFGSIGFAVAVLNLAVRIALKQGSARNGDGTRLGISTKHQNFGSTLTSY